MTTQTLKKFFEENGFNVYLTEQDGVQCAEIEKWTNAGVDMIMWLNPFTIKQFCESVDKFDVDDKIMSNRQDANYRKKFTLRESLKDFEAYHRELKKIKKLSTKLVDELGIVDYGMLCHISREDAHFSKHSGIFNCEGHPLHGKKFFHESKTKVNGFMEYGKTTSSYYLEQEPKKSFRTMKALVKFYSNENKD